MDLFCLHWQKHSALWVVLVPWPIKLRKCRYTFAQDYRTGHQASMLWGQVNKTDCFAMVTDLRQIFT